MKLAKIRMDTRLLADMFGLPQSHRIVQAHIESDYTLEDTLVLMIASDDLDESFVVQEGEKIKDGCLLIQDTRREAQITPRNA
jgi:dUTPase